MEGQSLNHWEGKLQNNLGFKGNLFLSCMVKGTYNFEFEFRPCDFGQAPHLLRTGDNDVSCCCCVIGSEALVQQRGVQSDVRVHSWVLFCSPEWWESGACFVSIRCLLPRSWASELSRWILALMLPAPWAQHPVQPVHCLCRGAVPREPGLEPSPCPSPTWRVSPATPCPWN